MKRLFLIHLFLFLVIQFSFSQKKIKFGKIDKADLSMTIYEADSSAKAVILYDNGNTDLVYNTSTGFQYTFDRHLRIKILKKSGLDLADFSIPLYQNSDGRENVIKFNAITHTLKNGKVEEIAVNKGDLLTEKSSKNHSIEKIAMPKVQVGSIIEIRYTMRSPFYWNLQDWQYQYEIPVRYSEYRINYPEWFNYNVKFKGYDFQYIQTLKLEPDAQSITFNSVRRSGQYVVRSQHTTDKVDYQRVKYGWVAENMPAFVAEAHISAVNNYLVKVSFELSSTNFPNSPFRSYVTNWKTLGETMLEADDFGKQLSKGRIKFLANETNIALSNATTPTEKIGAIYYHLKQKMAWNGNYGIFVNTNLKNAFANGKGNIAELNLLLVAMLRQADFAADPVLLSTKRHGFLNPAFPSLSQFNYVIAKVNFGDGKSVLLDASTSGVPIDLLPARCLNEKGLIIHQDGVGWANLAPTGKNNITQSLVIALNENMEWVGNMNVRCKEYAASSMRYEYNNEDNEAAYVNKVMSKNDGLTLSNYKVEGLNQVGKGVKESYDVTFADQVIEGDGLLYFSPMLTYAMTENPFKLTERTYPVDFYVPQSKTYSLQYEIPAGYEVEEVPEKTVIALPEKGGQFSYSVKIQGTKILVLSQFKINKNLFLPTEYQALKEFYNIVAAKQTEQVVLKKS